MDMRTIASFNEKFLADARRYLDDAAFSIFYKKGLILRYFSIRKIPGLRFSFWMRLCHELRGKKTWLPLYGFAINRYNHYVYHYGISIPFNTHIDKGFYIGHFGCIIVSPAAVIGKNVNISQGVTIGKANRGNKTGVPIIGDCVYIGPGAKIFGAITIGNNVAIGANAVVTHDVPNNAVVAGAPARVISMKGADGYVNRKVE